MAEGAENVRLRVIITGRVQGVSFRASLRTVAMRHRVAGWVRNRSDGSVEAVLQGKEADVDAVLSWARRGPPGARVADLDVDSLEPEAHGDRFQVLR